MAAGEQVSLALVRTGEKYGPEYVDRIIAGVRRHMKIDHVQLLTDQPGDISRSGVRPGVSAIDIRPLRLSSWWGKMALFNPDLRWPGRTLYLDLDSVVIGDLSPLITHTRLSEFYITGSFTRAAGNLSWPCKYGSCVMIFPDDWGRQIWNRFLAQRTQLMKLPRGDQEAIERLKPDACLLQDVLSDRFFLNYRQLKDYPDEPPSGSSLVVFGGSCKPHNCEVPWVRSAWER